MKTEERTWKDKLRDPQWQKLRLKIMERDGWRCSACGSSDDTLNVHHAKYGSDPWDTAPKYLQTLCERCHKALGKHPKAGVRWHHGAFSILHCPMCGSTDTRDKGSYEACNVCGCRIMPDEWPDTTYSTPDWVTHRLGS